MPEAGLKKLLKQKKVIAALIAALLMIAACSSANVAEQAGDAGSASGAAQLQQRSSAALGADAAASTNAGGTGANANTDDATDANGVPGTLAGNWTPESGGLYFTSDQDPAFSEALKGKGASFEDYADLDYLGRCGPAFACIGLDLMPTQGRDNISKVKPTGWHTYEYDFINGGHLYNRCHLIAYSLAGENANARNLITGTRQMNEAMIMFEQIVSNYVTVTGNHCLYRVSPVFIGKELVARGVQMEALSVEDNGERVNFNVYLPNTQDGVGIDYLTGKSWLLD